MANDRPDSPVTCRTITGPVIEQRQKTHSPVTCGRFTGRRPGIAAHTLEFQDEDTYRSYNSGTYAFSRRNFARLRVNARKYFGPRNLDRCVLEALSGCLARQQDERCRPGRGGGGGGAGAVDDLSTARSKAKRQSRFLGLGRRDPFDALDNYETIHQSKASCSGEVLPVQNDSLFPYDLATPEFRAALLDSLVGALVRDRWDGLDVDEAFEKFRQEYLTGDRQVTRRRINRCVGVGRHKRPAALKSPRIMAGATEEDGGPTARTTTTTLPRLYRGKLITVSRPGRVTNWKVRYWEVNALDKVAAYGRK